MKKIILTLFLLLQTSIILGGKLLDNFLAHSKQNDLSALKSAIALHKHFLDEKVVLNFQLPPIINQFKIFEGMEEICKEIGIDITALQKILIAKQEFIERMTILKNNFQYKAREIFKQKISPQEIQKKLELLKITPKGLSPTNPNEITEEEKTDFDIVNKLFGTIPQDIVRQYGSGTMKEAFEKMKDLTTSTHTKIKTTSHKIKEVLSEIPGDRLLPQQCNQIRLAEKRAQLKLKLHERNNQHRRQLVSPENLAANFTEIFQQTSTAEELTKHGMIGIEEMANFNNLLNQYKQKFDQTHIDNINHILKIIITKIVNLQRLKTKSSFPIPISVLTPEEKATEEKIEKEREKQFAEDLITITKGNALLSLNTKGKSKKVKHQESPPQPRKTEIHCQTPKTITDFFAGENYSINLFDLRLHFQGKKILPEKIPNVIAYTERVNRLFAYENNIHLVPHFNNGVPTLFDSHNGSLLERVDLFHLFSKLVDPEAFRYGIWEEIKHKNLSDKVEKQIQVSILAEISYNRLPAQLGIIQYTFDSNGKCYHRWFQPLQNLKFSPQLKKASRYFLTEFIKLNGQKITNDYQQYLNALVTDLDLNQTNQKNKITNLKKHTQN